MSSSNYGFLHNENLPDEESIFAYCKETGYGHRGTTLLNTSSGSVIAWIKYGVEVTIDEARTQDWAAKALEGVTESKLRVPRVFHAFTRKLPQGKVGYIAMEFIDSEPCTSNNVDIVAGAVQTLINLKGPDSTLGHIGGGSIVHLFFHYEEAIADYKSVKDLQDHINNILERMKHSRRVDIVTEAENGLYLCPSDIVPKNFRKCKDGRTAVFDFHASCFMPPSFIGVVMQKNPQYFDRMVAAKIAYPMSENVLAMVSASDYLIQFGPRPFAFPPGLEQKWRDD